MQRLLKRKNELVVAIAPTRGCSVDSLALRLSASSGVRFGVCTRTRRRHVTSSSRHTLTGATQTAVNSLAYVTAAATK